jgi:malic enzyme
VVQDVDEIIAVVKAVAPGFAGINPEDISAPRCFEIARHAAYILPSVFHADVHRAVAAAVRTSAGEQADSTPKEP